MLSSTHKKDQKQKKDGGKVRKALYKFMNNAVYEKTMENLKIELMQKTI